MNKSQENHLVVLYDRYDVEEFNLYNKNKYSDVFIFSPGLEFYLKDVKKLNIYKPNIDYNSMVQKKIIVNSKNLLIEFEKNINHLKNFDKGIIENIYNIFFISAFSFTYLIENLKYYKKFAVYYKDKWIEFENFNNFISLKLEKIFLKKNQDFFYYLNPRKITNRENFLVKINNFFLNFFKNRKTVLVVGSLLSKRIFRKAKNVNVIIQLKPISDFKIYHIFLNFFTLVNFFNKKKNLFFFPLEDQSFLDNKIEDELKVFFNTFKNKYFSTFKYIILESLKNYLINQLKLKKSISELVYMSDPKCIFVDQLRFGVSTILASICKSKDKNIILVPHGSISVPDSKFSEFVLQLCARGLVYSKLADFSVAQSKISNEAIKYYDKRLKILKSEPILFGKIFKDNNADKKNKFIFLHASTPKSLSKWPWIYENYNEYIKNINDIINYLKNKKNIELIIRFREGPECDLNTFKKLINIEANNFVKISKNKNFFNDLKLSDCLISFSSTSIEETLYLNKKVLIYSSDKNYKHINYNFGKDNSIYYSNKININEKIDQILNDNQKKENDILWKEPINENESLRKFL